MKTSSSFKYITFALSALLLLPGCKFPEWLKEKFSRSSQNESREVTQETITTESPVTSLSNTNLSPDIANQSVITLDGKTITTGKDFDRQVQLISQLRPEIQQFLPLMPDEQKLQFLAQVADTQLAGELILREIKRKGVDQTLDYKERAQQVHDMIDNQLAQAAFNEELLKSIKITDEEAQKYYIANKDSNPLFKRPPFLIHNGGVKAEGFSVATEKEAQDLLSQAKKGTSLPQLAQSAKSTVIPFGALNMQNVSADANIRKKALEIKTFPSYEVVKGTDNNYWIVKFVEKVEPEIAPFEQVKDKIKEILVQNTFNDILMKKLEELKANYKAKINTEFFPLYLKKGMSETPDMEMITEESLTETAPANNL